MKDVKESLEGKAGIKPESIEYLAMYNVCLAHNNQGAKLATEWIRLALLTRDARRYWLDKVTPISYEATRKLYAEFAAAEVRRILEKDEIAGLGAKSTELESESQKTIARLRTKIDNLERGIFAAEQPKEPAEKRSTEALENVSAIEKQLSKLTTDNSSLKEARDSAEAALVKEKERNQLDSSDTRCRHEEFQKTVEALRKDVSNLTFQLERQVTDCSSLKESLEEVEDALKEEKARGQRELEDAKGLHESAQKTISALHEEISNLNSCISGLTTEESSIKNSLELARGALTKEKVRSRELEIRLEERVALGSKTQDPAESKLEKYLREELEKSQRHVFQQQKNFEALRDDHVRLQVANATLESQVKQNETVKEELSRTSKREYQELAEKNLDLTDQLMSIKAQFEQLRNSLSSVEKGNDGEASKSKFSLRDIYRRPKQEASRLQTPPMD